MCASAPLPTLPMPRGVRTASMMNASAICESPGFVLRISFVDDGNALRCVETDRTALRIRHVGVPAHRTGSEEPTSELQSLMRNSYSVFCFTKKNILITYIIRAKY